MPCAHCVTPEQKVKESRLLIMNFGDVKALIFQRGWVTIAGATTVLIVPLTLTLKEQGLFFTFLSLAAIQSIFEAGITTAFFNYVAHERAKLTSDPPPANTDRLRAEARLHGLVGMARCWFLVLAILFAILVGTLGYYFVDVAVRREGLSLHWQTPFLLLVGAISLSLYNLSRIPILEGHGLIADVANFRLRSSMLSAAVLWATMVAGGGLWALAISYVIQSATMTAQISRAYRLLDLPAAPSPHSEIGDAINWRKDILPLQLRLAGSYFCGYFIAQAVVPYILYMSGSEVAGQVGLMLSVFNALASILASYMYATGPKYATLIARRDNQPLAGLFFKVTAVTLVAALAVYTLVLLCVYSIQYFDLAISHRIASLQVVLWLAVIGLVNAYVGSAATLLRAQKKEPMLPVSIVVAFGYVLAMVALPDMGIEYLFMAFAAVQMGLALPFTIMILRGSGLLQYRHFTA